jgi:ParB-like nuclease domain
MRRNVKSIKLEEIVISFFVRRELNEQRVSQLIKLLEARVELPPIKVYLNPQTEKYEVIDGRHRLEAHRRLEYDSIDCNVIDEPDFAKRVGMAVSANSSGPLTATDEDFEIALQALLDAQVSVRRILEVFPLPKSYTMKIIHNVKSKLYKAATTQAVEAIVNRGLTVSKAAEEYKVDTAAIKQRITGRQKQEKDQITDFTGGFSHRIRSFQKSNTVDYNRLYDAYDMGKLTAEATRKIFKSGVRSMKAVASVAEDYALRFDSRLGAAQEEEKKAG